MDLIINSTYRKLLKIFETVYESTSAVCKLKINLKHQGSNNQLQ